MMSTQSHRKETETMGKLLKRAWRYLSAALTGKLDEVADPKVQIGQAIAEAQQQHKLLRQRAAAVIASQKETQLQLDRALANLEKTQLSTKQALLMAEEASAAGDEERAAQLTDAAETFANRLVVMEDEVATLERLLLQATEASDQAKAAVAQNAMLLERQKTERAQLLNQLGQAEMAEQLNATMESISDTVGTEVPTLDEVRSKIEGRLARAQGEVELRTGSVQGRMAEVEQAAMSNQARARLSRMRSELGIAAPATADSEAASRDAIEAEIEAAVAEARSDGESQPGTLPGPGTG
jgi:phage shock protein A